MNCRNSVTFQSDSGLDSIIFAEIRELYGDRQKDLEIQGDSRRLPGI